MAGPDVAQRIRAGLVAFAAGDALGLPWEGRPPREIRRDAVLAAVRPVEGRIPHAMRALFGPRRGEGPAGGEGLAGALAAGWAQPDARARRAAVAASGLDAWAVAELAAWALERRPLHHAVREHGEEWAPPFRGVRGDRAVVSALLALVHRHDDPSDAMLAAVRLGGETALLAALAGAIQGCRRPEAVARVPWLDRVALPPEATLDALAARVAAARGR